MSERSIPFGARHVCLHVDGALTVGSVALIVALVLALMNARDRRRDRAAAVVLRVCASPSLRGLIPLRVRAPLLSRRTVAFLDMPACVAADAWPTMRSLADLLPPDVGLVIETCLDRRPAGPAPSSRYVILVLAR